MRLFLCCKSDALALSAKEGGEEGEEGEEDEEDEEGEEGFKLRLLPQALLANAACRSSTPKGWGVLDCSILECNRDVKDKDDSPSVM